MKTTTSKRPWALGAASALLALLLALPARAATAGRPVACRYLQASGQHIELQLVIRSPAPATIIVVQNLPPGTVIEQAQPPVSRFDRRSGQAKWLLKGLGTGSFLIDLRLSQPARTGELHGLIRYKHPATGAMITQKIAPQNR